MTEIQPDAPGQSGMHVQSELRGDARTLAGMRLAIGVVQGLVLYLLYSAYDAHTWPATNGAAFAPLLLVSLYLPLLVTQAIGNLRAMTLIIWSVAAAALMAGLAWYDLWRQWPEVSLWHEGVHTMGPPLIPSFEIFFFGAAGFCIAHALVTGGDSERRLHASYPVYFDAAWKFGTQLALSAAFTGAFWLLLWLGSELFQLIGLHFLEKLIEHGWFSIPVTALAVAMALHVTDVRAGLVRGARTLALVLLSWLLPLMALFAIGFFVALPFTGLEPLWQTKSAAGMLLLSAGALVVLINATYQDGENEHHAVPAVLHWAVRAAALVLVPVSVLAAYAIYLRVAQYGWSVDRVSSVAVAFVALGYALGYAMAAALPGIWMQFIQRWNFLMAFVVLTVLLALFTPIADPARISVTSQVTRLDDGRIAPEQFDFTFLHFHGERFGHDALVRLSHAKGAKADYIRRTVRGLLDGTTPTETGPTADDLATNFKVYPAGRTMPKGLLEQSWIGAAYVPICLTYKGMHCDAFFIDLDGDGHEEIVITTGENGFIGSGYVFGQGPDGKWMPVATIAEARCNGALTALRQGKMTAVPAARDWRDIDAGGIRLHLLAVEQPDITPCPH